MRFYVVLAFCFVLGTSVFAQFEETHTTCKRDYKKLGCFKEHQTGMKLLLTDRDQSSQFTSGFLLNWSKMKESLHSLACRCAKKAREGGYKYFSISYFAECWAGKQQANLDNILRDPNYRSNECVDPNFMNCENSAEHECAGKANNDYLYTLESAAAEEVVNGAYSAWSDWSVCSTSCGEGIQERERACTNPEPKGNGKDCSELGQPTETKSCKVKECAVDGQYGGWESVGTCSKECGGGSQQEVRKCDNPVPKNGGKKCEGESTRTTSCNEQACPINGGFGSWRASGSCSKTCGGGSVNDVRKCDSPAPQHGGKECSGSLTRTRSCNSSPCPVNGGFTPFGQWQGCSRPCNGGTQERRRYCTNPSPANGGKGCSGAGTITRSCNTQRCAVNGAWSSWGSYGGCSKSCATGYKYSYRSCSNPSPKYGGRNCAGSRSRYLKCNTHRCPPKYSAYTTHRACEGSTLSLWCGTHYGKRGTLEIYSANYGRTSYSHCRRGIMWKSNCRAGSSHSKVTSACRYKNSCRVSATNGNFGDPCWGTSKYLEVRVRCKYY